MTTPFFSLPMRAALAALASLLVLAPAATAADALTGGVSGWVKDDEGAPQMGASVAIVADDGGVVKRVFTDHAGRFSAEGLLPGVYAVQVSLSRFLPVVQRGVRIGPGERAALDVSLRSVFASLHLMMPGRSEIRDMSDNWKWVLRSSYSSRPALRFAPSETDAERREVLRRLGGAFQDTRAYAEVSGGEVRSSGLANQSNLGTTFAVATSLFGENNVTVSGNVGYDAAASSPTRAFRTTYRRELGPSAPEVSVMVRQLQSSVAAGRAFLDPQLGAEAPDLQTFTLGYADRIRVGDSTRVEYGVLYESVRFLERMNYLSPYGRIVREIGPRSTVEVSYASGVPRPEESIQRGERLRQQASSLGLFPRMALRDGAATVQRTEHIEIAYRRKVGDKGLIEAGVYQDTISDAALAARANSDMVARGDILPDLFSQTSTINGGDHRARGYRVSYARKIRDRLEAALGYGSGGALAPRTNGLGTTSAAELRRNLVIERAHMLMASVSAAAPGADTRVLASYQWTSRPSAIGVDLYNDFAARSAPGLNLVIRQPLPLAPGLPGKLEASADFRNLLKTGYLPLQAYDGQTMYLLQAVRSYRGSLSFIF